MRFPYAQVMLGLAGLMFGVSMYLLATKDEVA